MKVTVTYQIKSGETRSKAFIRETVKEALAFFNWRYGHKIINVEQS